MPLHSSAWSVTSVPFTFLHIIIVSYLTFTLIAFLWYEFIYASANILPSI